MSWMNYSDSCNLCSIEEVCVQKHGFSSETANSLACTWVLP